MLDRGTFPWFTRTVIINFNAVTKARCGWRSFMGIHPIVSITCGGDSAKSHHSSGFTMGMPSTLAHAQTLRMCGHSSNPWIWPLGDPQCGRFSKRWRVPRSLKTCNFGKLRDSHCEMRSAIINGVVFVMFYYVLCIPGSQYPPLS